MEPGCYTALITPFNQAGELDKEGLEQLINFQIENNITGILATGTTGESPTFKWKEHDDVIARVAQIAKDKCARIAGTGSNNTDEALKALVNASKEKVDAVLMVDPYYNGPSSLEIMVRVGMEEETVEESSKWQLSKLSINWVQQQLVSQTLASLTEDVS